MTLTRQILHSKHPDVDRWAIKTFAHKGKYYIVDAIDPVVYHYEHGIFWKQYNHNKKHYELCSNMRDQEYMKALRDISKIKN